MVQLKQICHLQISKKLEGMCFCLRFLCLLKVSLPTFFSKKVGMPLPDKFELNKKEIRPRADSFIRNHQHTQ